MALDYDKTLKDIQALQNQNLPKEVLVEKVGKLLVEGGAGDKFGVYVDDYVSLNISLGEKWVNKDLPEGTDASKTTPIVNPTYRDAKDPSKSGAHPELYNKRMDCIVAAIETLKKAGINNIALQEAPPKPDDYFYQACAKQGLHVFANVPPKSNNQGLAMVGKELAPGQFAQEIAAINASAAKAGIGTKKTQKGDVPSGELQFAVSEDGKNLIVNLHLNWGDAAKQQKQIEFLNAISKIDNVVALGDSNIDKINFDQAKEKPNGITFGSLGCSTVDIIAKKGLTFLHHYHDPFVINIDKSMAKEWLSKLAESLKADPKTAHLVDEKGFIKNVTLTTAPGNINAQITVKNSFVLEAAFQQWQAQHPAPVNENAIICQLPSAEAKSKINEFSKMYTEKYGLKKDERIPNLILETPFNKKQESSITMQGEPLCTEWCNFVKNDKYNFGQMAKSDWDKKLKSHQEKHAVLPKEQAPAQAEEKKSHVTFGK